MCSVLILSSWYCICCIHRAQSVSCSVFITGYSSLGSATLSGLQSLLLS